MPYTPAASKACVGWVEDLVEDYDNRKQHPNHAWQRAKGMSYCYQGFPVELNSLTSRWSRRCAAVET